MKEKKSGINFTSLILIILLVMVAFLGGTFWTKLKSNNNQNIKTKATPTLQPTPTQSALELTLGNFSITKDEICQEDGKPSIYYFGYSGCPHCKWDYPIMETVAKKFPTQIVFHDNMDKLDKLTAQDSKIYSNYQEIHGGAVPFLAFGCKYVRVGSGENSQETDGGKASEEKNLTAIICKLTNGQPEKVCASVKDLVEQVQ